MKKNLILGVAALLLVVSVLFPVSTKAANSPKMKYTDALSLTMVGKLMDTPNPYHRVDTVKYKGFTAGENRQVRMTTGMAIAFKTDSPIISITPEYGYAQWPNDSNAISAKGFNLYIKQDGKWLFAAAKVNSPDKLATELVLISGMDTTEKECLLYLPLNSELYSLLIGVEDGASIEAIPNPFRYRIGVFGSSFTHGASTTRSGMAYPAQLGRMTGLQFLNLGCSGNCKLQDYFADVLCDAQVDALLFDSFSNPSPAQIQERLFPFIEKLQAAHPGIPLIFQRTIYRESRNFDRSRQEFEANRIALVDSLMAIACDKYSDVYYIYPNATEDAHETSVDGTHPDNKGYTLWAESIRKPLLKILKKYGIK